MFKNHEEEKQALEAAGFVYDPVCGYTRWTRFKEPMITALRQPWMRDQDWYEHCQKKIKEALG